MADNSVDTCPYTAPTIRRIFHQSNNTPETAGTSERVQSNSSHQPGSALNRLALPKLTAAILDFTTPQTHSWLSVTDGYGRFSSMMVESTSGGKMSSPPFIYIDEFDGTNGYVKTKGFVNYFKEIQSHEPHQKVYLGDSERGNIMRPCVVFNDEITLEKGCGYRFGGFDHQWDDGEEIQLKLSEGAWVDKFYDPNKE